MHRPTVLIVDELRNGLDPLAAVTAEKLLREAADAGCCVIASTHDLWWAERTAQESIILQNGRIAVHDTVSRLRRQHGSLESLFLSLAGAVV